MLNEVHTKIKLTRSKDSLCLMAVGAQVFKVKISSAAFLARKVKIGPSVYLALYLHDGHVVTTNHCYKVGVALP